MNKPAWLALAGPTASGKTGLALALAQHHPIEVISVDSALVYRGMDIGTAKPSAHERAAVPHHLIDIRQPTQAYSAAAFVQDATALVGDIQRRGNTPVLVGGTMLYFKVLFEGLDPIPTTHMACRADIQLEAEKRGWPAMHAALAAVDPITAGRLSPNDSQRISRALEVFRSSGQTLSSFQLQRHTPPLAAPLIAGQSGRVYTLEPQNRAWLHERINSRFLAMLAAGFLEEVKALQTMPGLTPDLPAMRCVGYRQAWEWLETTPNAPGQNGSLQTLIDTGTAATRQLAKRQLTWLRSMPYRHVLFCDEPGFETRALSLLLDNLTP